MTGMGDFKFIVPGKSLTDVSRLLSDSEEMAEISVGKHNIVFLINGYSVVSRLLTGKFTDCSMLFNTAGCHTVQVKTSDVLAAVERMALVISESYKSPVRCSFSENSIKFSCETPVGRADSVIPCRSDCQGMTMGIDNRVMVDAFKAVDTDEIRIMIVDRMRPMIILPPDGDHYKFLIMPLNLNDVKPAKPEEDGHQAPRKIVEADNVSGEPDYEAEADFGNDRYDD